MEGILITDKDYEKLSEKEKETVKEFVFNGETKYAKICSKSLTLKTSGGNNIKYVVKIDKNGVINYMYVNNGLYDYLCINASSCKAEEIYVKAMNENCGIK